MLLLFQAPPAAADAGPWTRCKPRALAGATARELGLDPTVKRDLEALLRDAVTTGQTHSAALVVLRRGRVLYRGGAGGAGPRSIFDLASLTKVVATAPVILSLVQRGRLSLGQRASRHLGQLAGADKRGITVRQLLLHTSGLPSVVWAGKLTDGRKQILPRIRKARMKALAGQRYGYSDTGYIVLGELARARGGKRLDALAHDHLYRPLGMCSTGFNPPAAKRQRLISPWPEGGKLGQVYDPLAARLDGVAGHAGLFSTADDLARFGQMMQNGGQLQGQRVLSAATVARMVKPRALPGRSRKRGMGWDLAPASGRLSARSYGHGGFTGTSLWIDPRHQLVLVLLTNRTRLTPAPSVYRLRRRIHALVLGALARPPKTPVRTGLDRLVDDNFAALAGRRVGLITNRAAVDHKGRWIVDLLAGAPRVKLQALFVPEHGLSARQDRRIADSLLKHGGRRIPVRSLFGARRRPHAAALAGLDTLVFDVPTVGVRYYTYLSTMGWAMEAAAKHGLRFVVLDRPDPLGGKQVQGPLSGTTRRNSTNYHPLPLRYGMTVGELARYFNGERKLGARLRVLRVTGWRRGQSFAAQGLPWRDPSPNIRSWRQALLYGGTGMVEGTNVAVGRGTDSPFQLVGAPWIRGPDLARELNRRRVPGVYWTAARFTPASSRHRGKLCQGVRAVLLHPRLLNPARLGLALAASLRKLYPKDWKTANLYKLIGHPATTRALLSGRRTETIPAIWRPGLRRFLSMRKKYLMY